MASKKYPKNKLSLVTEVGEQKNQHCSEAKNVKQPQSEIPNLKGKLLSSEKIDMKSKQLKTEQLLTQTFSTGKI